MSLFSWSIVEVNLVIVILFMGYLAIKNRLNFRDRRRTLLSLPFLAIAAMFIKSLFDFSAVSYSMPIINLQPVYVGQSELVAPGSNPTFFSWSEGYALGVITIGLIFCIRLVLLGRFFFRNESRKVGRYYVYNVRGKDSFSFFNRIQIAAELSDLERGIVLEHEKLHADKWHSMDTILIEILHVIFWFNPVFFFIKRELINLHEFQVDALMYEKHRVNYMKFLLNFTLGSQTSNYLFTSQFYNRLTLTKRIKSMKTNYQKKSWMILLIPAAACLFIMIQCTKKDLTLEENRMVNSGESLLQSNERVYDWYELFPDSTSAVLSYFGKMWDDEWPFMAHVLSNIHYPEEALANQEEGSVLVGIVTSPEGIIEKTWIIEGVSPLLDAEALRVVNEVGYIKPTSREGQPVSVSYTMPIIFDLEYADKLNDPNKQIFSELDD